MKILVDASKFKSASVCKSVKDIRFYLNGVFLAPNGDAVGTDGHCMTIAGGAFTAVTGFEGVIVEMVTKIPAKCETIEFDTDNKIARFLSNTEQQLALVDFTVVDGRYPDYNRVVPKKIEKVESIGINAELVGRAAKVFHGCKYPGVKFEFCGADGAVKLTHPEMPQVLMIVMPCRL